MSDILAGELVTPDAGEAPLLSLPTVSILKAAPIARLSFRATNEALVPAATAFGLNLPINPLSCITSTRRAALWLGPDEWLLLVFEEELSSIFATMEQNLEKIPHALVDVSDRSDAIIVSGERAAWLLNTGIFLDLSQDAFPVGAVTRTVFHKATIMLWRTGPDSFVVEAWGSFMDYVSGLLVESAQELIDPTYS